MTDFNFVKAEKVSLKNHPSLSEKWVADRIAEDPGLLGLGDVVLKDRERIQPHAGRLDLLLQDTDSSQRYEVELQLGATDETHIIRTIEYWDIERKRYPQYDHCAVIVAEDITARFLNVIGLFNGMIPLIAIQLSALRFGNTMTLVFTKVLDEMTLGFVDEEEEVQEVTDRSYWEARGTPRTVALADELLEIIHEFDSAFELKYNKFYIGLAKDGQPNNFASFRARKSHLRLEVRLPDSDEMRERLEQAGLDLMEYDARWRKYRIRLTESDLRKNRDLISEMLRKAYDLSAA
ncbi:MAG: hypothetical protein KGY81_09315 [Phycisphaerae bacterium]|nr:hypothetical protein [Phycisphaerae bacterium]